ncbi:MAG: hypothetical protein WCF57_05875 [Pyrinomonadaceae bacterium]
MRKRNHLRLAGILAFLILCGLLGWLIIRGLNRGSLVMEAQVVRRSGAKQAVARETFYLLDIDIIRLAMIEGNERSPLRDRIYSEHPNLGMVALVMDARRRSAYSLGAEVMPFVEDSRPLWESHVVRSAQTDAGGRAVFKGLKPGDYWLMGRMETGAGAAFWNQPVSVGRGENQITLDQNNALYVKSD